MLSRDGPYEQTVQQLIRDLEGPDAEGSLTPTNRALLGRLKQHLVEVRSLDRRRPADWARLGELIGSLDAQAHPTQRPFVPFRARS
jgi:hypothetical protein